MRARSGPEPVKLHYLQHVPFETPGHILDWAAARGAIVSSTRFHAGESLPDPAVVDAVVVMGGPMGVHDEARFPWLVQEKRWLDAVIAHDRPVFGVCLGAQLLAHVLGARVAPHHEREIGWFDVTGTAIAAGATHWRGMPGNVTAFHWHGDRFDIPHGAVHLALSACCYNQAFQYGTNVVGLQCHLECDMTGIEALLTHCGAELVPGAHVQDVARIRAGAAFVEPMHDRLATLLDNLFAENLGSE